MINEEAVALWQQYQAETDPIAAEMLRQAYLRALNDPGPDPVATRLIGPAESEENAAA